MKIQAFDNLYNINRGTGTTILTTATGSNALFGGDVEGEPGELSVVGMRREISLGSNLGSVALGDVLTIISTGSTPVARFAAASNSLTSETIYTVSASGSAVNIDFDLANIWDITLTANCTLTISNPPSSGTLGVLLVILRQGIGAPWTVTWPAAVQWQDTDGTDGGPPPTLWTVVDARNVFTILTEDGGVTYGGSEGTGGGTTSPLTTKGDLYGYSTTNARFAVGSNGDTIIADSTQTLGLRYSYQAPSGEILVSDTPAGSPLVFADLLQNELQNDLLYGDL